MEKKKSVQSGLASPGVTEADDTYGRSPHLGFMHLNSLMRSPKSIGEVQVTEIRDKCLDKPFPLHVFQRVAQTWVNRSSST